MAKARRNSLLDEVEKLPEPQSANAWYAKLKAKNPTLMDDVNTLIDEWWQDKHRAKLPTKSHLARFLAPKVTASWQHVVRYIDKRADENSR